MLAGVAALPVWNRFRDSLGEGSTAEGMGWPSETKLQSDFRFQLGALAHSEESQPQCHELPYGEN